LGADLRQLDIDEIAELLGGDRGDADGDRAVAVIRDPFVGGGVLQSLWQFHGSSSRHVRPLRSMPPLSVCLRNWRCQQRTACSFGEAARAFSPERPCRVAVLLPESLRGHTPSAPVSDRSLPRAAFGPGESTLVPRG